MPYGVLPKTKVAQPVLTVSESTRERKTPVSATTIRTTEFRLQFPDGKERRGPIRTFSTKPAASAPQ